MMSLTCLLAADPMTFVLIALALIVLAAFIGLAVPAGRKKPNQTADQSEESNPEDTPDTEDTEDGGTDEETDDGFIPPEPIAYPARVVDMKVLLGNVGGHKRPKTGTSFLVTFLTDDGERMEFPVPEELYVTLNVDQTGTLVILNEGFFDFGDGEDAE
jgi:hypothetical protein